MRQFFADISYFIALLSPDDVWHAKALELTRTIRGSMVTTQWVLTELADGFCRPHDREGAAALVRLLEKQENDVIVPATENWFHRGLLFYETRPDKEFSLTDCISFLVMGDYGLTESLTADHQFEQAGFSALLK